MNKTDYYHILGVEKKASADDIKKAYRNLAKKYHPDKQGGDESKFKEITEAYAVLGNEKKRSEYDSYGRVFNGGGGGSQGGFGGAGFNWSDFASQAGRGGVEFDMGDIFGEFFGGGRRRQQKRGRDISFDIQLDLEEAVFGTERTIGFRKAAVCDTCGGDGAEVESPMKKCETCNGNGKIQEVKRSILGQFSSVRICDDCRGVGQVPEKKCKECKGRGVVNKNVDIKVTIPAGISDGEMIRMSGHGEVIRGGVAGDLYIKIHVKPHAHIKKEGKNLIMNVNVKLSDALLGATYIIQTLDGSLDVKIPQGIGHGELLRVRDRGVPLHGGVVEKGTRVKRGDLLLKVSVNIPNKLSRRARKAVEELREEGV